MLNWLWKWINPSPVATKPVYLYKVIDFTQPAPDHWAKFQDGDNYDAMFVVRGTVQLGDEILVRLTSGKIGRYHIFSCRHDFTGVGDYCVRCAALGYWPDPSLDVVASYKDEDIKPKIKGLLTDGSRWVRSDSGELAHLPSGFTLPTSEFWEILNRDPIRRDGTSGSCSTSNL